MNNKPVLSTTYFPNQYPETVITFIRSSLFQAQPAVHVQGQEPLTPSMLAAAPPQEQKQMLGNNINIVYYI